MDVTEFDKNNKKKNAETYPVGLLYNDNGWCLTPNNPPTSTGKWRFTF